MDHTKPKSKDAHQAHSPNSGLLSRRQGGSSVEGTCMVKGGEIGDFGARWDGRTLSCHGV